MKRPLLILAALFALAACLLLPFWGSAVPTFSPRGTSVELPVIMYHSLVTADSAASQYVCPISRVESDLAWLQAEGYQSVSLADLQAFVQGSAALPPKPVLITLDDGYRNNLTLLPALLEQYDAHAVIAVVGEYADIYTASGEDGSPHSCMGWEDVTRAAAQPRLELANHSYYFHHLTTRKGSARMPGEDKSHWQDAFFADTRRLQTKMAEICGSAPVCYAYPFGQITPGTDMLLRQMGFQISLTCNEQRSVLTSGDPDCLFSLGRFNRDGRLSTEAFMRKMLG